MWQCTGFSFISCSRAIWNYPKLCMKRKALDELRSLNFLLKNCNFLVQEVFRIRFWNIFFWNKFALLKANTFDKVTCHNFNGFSNNLVITWNRLMIHIISIMNLGFFFNFVKWVRLTYFVRHSVGKVKALYWSWSLFLIAAFSPYNILFIFLLSFDDIWYKITKISNC